VSFKLWSGAALSLAYWTGVRAEGMSRALLGEVIGQPLRVLSFHSISEPQRPADRDYCLSPQRFMRVVRALERRGFRHVSVKEYGRKAMEPRSVALTFDDGYEDFYRSVFPLVGEMALKPTVFVVAGQVGGENVWDVDLGRRRLLSSRQIVEMHRAGVDFGSHGLTHRWLPGLDDAELRAEVCDSKARLEDLLGAEVDSFAYPYGGVDARVRAMVAEAGYATAMTTAWGANLWRDPLLLRRIELSERDTRIAAALKVMAGFDLRSAIAGCREQLGRVVRGAHGEGAGARG